MESRHRLLTLAVVLLILVNACANAAPPDVDPQTAPYIEKAIGQLGSRDVSERLAAADRLLLIGSPALPAVKKAARDADPAIRLRCQALLGSLSRGLTRAVTGLALARDGQTALIGHSDGSEFYLWQEETLTRKVLIRFQGIGERPSSGIISGDGNLAVTTAFGADAPREGGVLDCPIVLWDLKSGREVRRFRGQRGSVGLIEYSADEFTLISSGYDFTARTWNVATGEQIACFKGHTSNVVTHANLSPDGKLAVSGGSDDGTVRFWDPKTGASIRNVELGKTNVCQLRFDSRGQRLAAGMGHHESGDKGNGIGVRGSIRLLDVQTGKELQRIDCTEAPPIALQWSPDEKRLVTGSADSTVRVWEIESGKQLACFKTKEKIIRHVVISADGRRIFTLSDNGVFERFDMP
jgi:hypothetical protein